MSDSELIDWEQLSMIFGDEGEELDEDMAELFVEFVEDGTKRFVAIKDLSFTAENKERIAMESHKLKGSASNFGFRKVAALLGTVEDGIDSISEDDFRQALAEASGAFAICIDKVKARYPSLGA